MAEARRRKSGSGEWHTVADAADMLGVSVSTVRRWIRAGRLHAYRIGPKAIRLRNDEVRHAEMPVPDAAHGGPYNMMAHIYTDIEEALRPMTEAEKRRALAAIAAADDLRLSILRRRGGRPLPDSTPIIRAARSRR